MSARIVKRRYLRDNIIRKTKHDSIVTSTPLRNNTTEKLAMEWISPVIKCSRVSPNPIIPLNSIGVTRKMTQPDSDNENEKSERYAPKENASIDKICLINNLLELNDTEHVSSSNDNNVENKNKRAKQLVVMNSDEEEEFWCNRHMPERKRKNIQTTGSNQSSDSKPLRRSKRTKERVEAPKPAPVVEDEASNPKNEGIIIQKIDQNRREAVARPGKKYPKKSASPPALPAQENKAKRLRRSLEVLKELPREESTQVSDPPVFAKPSNQAVGNTESKNNEDILRRSTRTRYEPLEFWNGERLHVSIDLTSGIRWHRNNSQKRKVMQVQDIEVEPEREELEQPNLISSSTLNLRSKHERGSSLTEISETKKKRKSILKTRTNITSKPNVRFSAIGTGTTIDGPTSKNNTKPDWMINFAGIHPKKELLLASENCIISPGLNTSGRIISSALLQMRGKSVNQSRAPDLCHLMFCVMAGTVSVTINETTVRMETYGHFTVPCGVAYSIQNIRKHKAILSYFEVSYRCV